MQGQSTSASVQAAFERLGKSPATVVLLGQHYMDSQVVAQIETKTPSQCKTTGWDVRAGRRLSEEIRVWYFVTVLLEKGAWSKFRLIHFRVRIASSPNHKDCVEMGPGKTQWAGRPQVKVVLVPTRCLCGSQALPTAWARHGQSTVEEDEWNRHLGWRRGARRERQGGLFLCDEMLVSGHFKLRHVGWRWYQHVLGTGVMDRHGWFKDGHGDGWQSHVKAGLSVYRASSQSNWFWSLLIWAGLQSTA